MPNLTTPYAEQLLHRIVDGYNVAGVRIALPCGTCSRARGIPLPDGPPGPPPLRDADHLHGLPGLSDVDGAKVKAANGLYAWADRLNHTFSAFKRCGMDNRKPHKFLAVGTSRDELRIGPWAFCETPCMCVWW